VETYLNLFEEAIKRQAELVGEQEAFDLAKQAGLGVSRDGHIVSCTGNPQLVLLRLIKQFTKSGSIAALAVCSPMLDKVMEALPQEIEEAFK